MKRIFVTGNAGSGKSTFASSLARALDLPLHGLDQIVWQSGWRKTSHEHKARQIEALINSSDEWVIEGVSNAVMNAADTIVFLDIPRYFCLWRCAKRNLPYLFRSRPGLPDRCPEILIIPQLLRIIWNFPKAVRPSILSHTQAAEDTKSICVVDKRTNADAILSQLARTRRCMASPLPGSVDKSE